MVKKICLSCSVGGHLTQMRQLNKLYQKYEYFFITEDTEITRIFAKNEKVYLLKLINRKKWDFLLVLIYNTIITLKCLMREKPDLIICTGALSTLPCCVLGKLLGIRLVFIESFAKLNTPTLTGKLVYRFADLFIVQWEPMLKHYPKAVYGGSVY